MLLARALGMLLLIAAALCLGAWLLTGQRQYFNWAKNLFRFGLAAALAFMALLLFERLLAPLV